MSTKNNNVNITKELQDTVRSNEKIEKVFFDKNGNHYFNTFKLQANAEDKQEREYGAGDFSHRQHVPGIDVEHDIKEEISYGRASTEITSEIDRDEILSREFTETSDLIGTYVTVSELQKTSLLEALLPKETIAALKSLAAQQDESTATPPKAGAINTKKA